MTDYEELAKRCEAATGADRELDAMIGVTLNGTIDLPGVMGCYFKPITRSLDAAMTLIDPECYWQVGHDGEGRDPSMFAARVFDPMLMKKPCTAVAETAALALCAAALRAKGETP